MPPRPDDDAGYLEAAARIIFMGGLNRQVVDSKWLGFRAAFHDFDIDRVADMTPDDVLRLSGDDRVIKYEAKLRAVVNNARKMQDLGENHGGFGAYVEGLLASGVPVAAKSLAKDFAYISEEGAKNWLYSTGHDVGEVSEKVVMKYAPYQPDRG